MERFKSMGRAQRFLFLHARVNNLFRDGRQLIHAEKHQLVRERSFYAWAMISHV